MTPSPSRPFARTLAWALAAVVGCAGLAACTTDDHDLPTMGGSRAGSDGPDLVAIAKAYSDCMTDGGVPVTLNENSEKELTVASFAEFEWYVACTDDSCMGGATAELTEAQSERMNKVYETPREEGAATLVIDGTDHSELYTRCLAETGYDETVAWGDDPYVPDPEQMQLQVDSNNRWASCARDNGWPNVQDSVMPTDLANGEWPTIELPDTITEEQLRQLLSACPNFDAEQSDKIAEYFEENPMATDFPEGYLPDPSITFSFPIFVDPENPTPEEMAAADAGNKLYEILYEAQQAYWEAQQEEGR